MRKWCFLFFLVLLLTSALGFAIGESEEEDPFLNQIVDSIPGQWEAGKNLVIDFSGIPYEGQYLVRLSKYDSNSYFDTFVRDYYVYGYYGEKTVTIDGYLLLEENYKLEVTALIPYIKRTKELRVTGNLSSGPAVSVSDSGLIHMPIQFSQSMRNIDQLLVLYYTLNDGEPEVDYYWLEGVSYFKDDTHQWNQAFDSIGKWGVRATARINDQWTSWSDLSVFSVGSLGRIDTPAFTVSDVLADEPISVQLTPVDNASHYVFSLIRKGEEWDSWLDQWTFSADDEISIVYNNEWDTLAPGAYSLSCIATGEGYENSYTYSQNFNVTGELVKPQFTLAKDTFLTGEFVQILLNETVESSLVELGWYVEAFDDIVYNYDQYFDSTKNIYFNPYGGIGDFYIRLKVKKNGLWSIWSDGLPLSIAHLGSIATPSDLTIADEPALSASGDITVDVNSIADGITVHIGTVEHAERYQLTLKNDLGSELDRNVSTHGGDFMFDTAFLEPGNYFIRVIVSALGYDSYEEEIPFEVKGAQQDPPTVVADTTSVKYGEKVTFDVYASGATKIRMYYGIPQAQALCQTFDAVNGRSVITIDPRDWEDRYSFSAYINGLWTARSETIMIDFIDNSADYELGVPNYTISPQEITTTSGMRIDLGAVSNALHGKLFIDSYETRDGFIREITDLSSPQAITIPANVFNKPGKYSIGIAVYADPQGYVFQEQYQDINVTGESISVELPSVSMPDERTAIFNQPITFTAQSDGIISDIQAIFMNSNHRVISRRPLVVDAGQSITAKFAITNMDSIGRDVNVQFRFKVDGIWSDFSDTYTFHLIDQLGTVTRPVPHLSAASVSQGQPVTVTFDTVDHVAEYSVSIAQHEREWTKFAAEEGVGYVLDTSALTPGKYFVRIDVVPEDGYTNTSAPVYAILQIKPASSGTLATLSLPKSLSAIETQAFYGTIAEKVVIPSGCQTIGSQAFAFAPNLTVAVIPTSVTNIAEDAFAGCGSLTIQTSSTDTAAYAFASAHGIPVTVEP